MIDPQIQKILYWAQRAAGPGYAQMGADAARAWYARAVLTLDVAPVPMHDVHDHGLELPGRSIAVRQYVPFGRWLTQFATGPCCYCHGGGFTIGSLDTRRSAVPCAGAGRALPRLFGRLSARARHRFPAAVDDAFAALDWLRAQAGSLGVDIRRSWVATAPEARWLRPARCMRATATSRWPCNC